MNKKLFLFRGKNTYQTDNKEIMPQEFLYGYNKYLGPSYEYIYLNFSGKKIIFDLINKVFSKCTKIGLPLIYLKTIKHIEKKYSKIFAVNDSLSTLLLLAKFLKITNKDIYVLFQSLPQRREYYFKYNFLFTLFYIIILKKAKIVFCLSNSSKRYLINKFHINKNKIAIFKFGIDVKFWKYKKYNFNERRHILSIGNDMNRNFDLLVDNIPNKDLLFVTNHKKIKKGNYTKITNISYSQLLKLYHNAKIVIISSTPLKYENSGLSSALQAMSAGTPVLLSSGQSNEEIFKNNKHCVFFEANNPSSLKKNFYRLISDVSLLKDISLNARRHVLETRSLDQMTLSLKQYF